MISHLGKPMTVSEAAEALGMSTDWVYRHYRELGGVKLGRSVRFFEKSISEYVYALQKEESAECGLELVRQGHSSKWETENQTLRHQDRGQELGSLDPGTLEELTGPDRHNLLTGSC